MAISSPGIGSGLDVSSIVEQLVTLERRPIEQLTAQKTTLQSKLSAFGLMQSYTVNVQDAVNKLTSASLWTQTKALTTDTSVSATSTATAVSATYSVDVTQLAQAQTLASGPYASTTTALGAGTLTITAAKVGSTGVDVVIDADDTLEDVRTKINAADAGVSASIVKDGAGSRLVLRSTATGEDNAVSIAATGDPALQQLSYDPNLTTGQMSQVQAAKNAKIKIDGLEVVSATNTFDGSVEGLKLTVSKTTTSPVQVKVGTDTEAMRKAVDDFVKAYNDINKYISDQTKYNEDTKVAGTLQGDRSTLSLQSQLRAVLTQSSAASTAFPRLSDLGLEIQRDGSLKVNNTKLNAAMNNNLEQLGKAFSNNDTAQPANNGFAVRIKALTSALLKTDGLVSTRTQGLRDSIERNEDQVAKMEDRVAAVQARLLRQYSAMDSSISKLNGLNSYVTQQLAALAKNYGK
ncbi:flagellar filament capping protein FliD [Aquabacterium sp. A7-Y]|uniref:flagellar filament capping protein FliD n=1 Tax=Aquabacterium sp. A7-Y TaxID=1349605 RepID=UPI00223D0011|nr:flagellar filament capping protein FliD [Aquabacterium sp. A7-Y]MCW7540538.1 flagellar filament capping protein FliD [Aquabacterium sp. A7-Y]